MFYPLYCSHSHILRPEEAAGAKFNEAFYMRVIRYLCLDDLRWCRWSQMTSHTYMTLTVKHVTDPEGFFTVQISQLLQRIVRHIPILKAWVAVDYFVFIV